MNLKEYLEINTEPILSNEKNIFVLLWIERQGYSTISELYKTTNIPINDITEVLHTLYKNGLISIQQDTFRITKQGIELLDLLGYSNLHIENWLASTSFANTEYNLYNDLFELYRKNHLEVYLIIVFIVSNEKKIFKESYRLLESSKENISAKDYRSLLYANIFHEFAFILRIEANSKDLISSYNKIFDYSESCYCYSSEIYHNASIKWQSSKLRSILNSSIRNSFQQIISKYIDTSALKAYLGLDINGDLQLTNQILNNNRLLTKDLFVAKEVTSLAQKLNLSKVQTLFILKSLQAQIEELINNEESS